MPVILAPEQWDSWLSPSTPSDQVQLAIAFPREDVLAHPVSTEVGNTWNDYAELLTPVECGPEEQK